MMNNNAIIFLENIKSLLVLYWKTKPFKAFIALNSLVLVGFSALNFSYIFSKEQHIFGLEVSQGEYNWSLVLILAIINIPFITYLIINYLKEKQLVTQLTIEDSNAIKELISEKSEDISSDILDLTSVLIANTVKKENIARQRHDEIIALSSENNAMLESLCAFQSKSYFNQNFIFNSSAVTEKEIINQVNIELTTTINRIKEVDEITLCLRKPTKRIIENHIDNYFEAIQKLLQWSIYAMTQCSEKHNALFVNIFKRLITMAEYTNCNFKSTLPVTNICYFPSVLFYYGTGISAVYSKKYSFLEVMFGLHFYESYWNENIMIEPFSWQNIVNFMVSPNEYDETYQIPNMGNQIYFELIKYFKFLFEDNADFDDYFNIFESLLSIEYGFVQEGAVKKYPTSYYFWFPRARFWQNSYSKNSIYKKFYEEADRDLDDWAPLKAFWGVNFMSFIRMKEKMDNYIDKEKRKNACT